MTNRRILAAVGLAALVLATAAGCPPRAGGSCDPKKDSSYYSTHHEGGKTTTVSLECKQVGINRYEWVKS